MARTAKSEPSPVADFEASLRLMPGDPEAEQPVEFDVGGPPSEVDLGGEAREGRCAREALPDRLGREAARDGHGPQEEGRPAELPETDGGRRHQQRIDGRVHKVT